MLGGAMPDYPLTDLQLDLLSALWSRGEATVVDIRKALRPSRDLAHTTVATHLSRMEKRGLVTRRTEGRINVYAAAVDPKGVRRSMLSELSDFKDRLFGGDIADLVTQLLNQNDVDADDLARVRQMIEAKEAELRKGKKK